MLGGALVLAAVAWSPFRHLGELELAKRSILAAAAVLCGAGIALDPSARRRAVVLLRSSPTLWVVLPGLALLAWTGLSLAWSPTTMLGAPMWHGWASAALLSGGAALLPRTGAERWRLARAVALAGALVALIGVVQYLLGWDAIPQKAPPGSSFGNRNFAAEVVVVALPYALGAALAAGATGRAVRAAALALPMGVYLLYARSSAAWLLALGVVAAFAAWLAVVRLRGGSGPRPVHLAGLAVALVLAIALGQLPPSSDFDAASLPQDELAKTVGEVRDVVQRGMEAGGRSSGRARLDLLYNTLPMLRDHAPWGVGLGGWFVHYPRYTRAVVFDDYIQLRSQPLQAHDDYLQLVAETGVPGGLCLVVLLGGTGLVARRALANAGTPAERWLARSAVVSVAVLCGNALVGFPLQNRVATALAAVGVGLLLGGAAPSPAEPAVEHEEPESPARKRLALGAVVVAAGLVVWIEADAWRRDLAVSRFLVLASQGQSERAISLGRALAERDRDDEVLLTRLGALLERREPGSGLVWFERIRRYDPWNPSNLMSIARSLIAAGRPAEAVAAAEQALEVLPGCLPCAQLVAERARASGHVDRAVATWESSLPYLRDRDLPRALRELYEAVQEHPSIPAAEAVVLRRIEADPGDALAYEQMALLRIRAADREGAARYYRLALERADHPDHAEVYRRNLQTLDPEAGR